MKARIAQSMYKAMLTGQATVREKCGAARQVLSSESGQGISEYLIILAVVVIAAIALATTFSDQLTALWDSVTTQLDSIS